MFDEFGDARDAACDDRHAAAHRLHQHHWDALALAAFRRHARRDDDIRRLSDAAISSRVRRPQQMNALAQPGLHDLLGQHLTIFALADEVADEIDRARVQPPGHT